MPSINELRQVCQHSEAAPSWRTQSLEGKFNRIFSIYLTWLLAKTPLTPNQITVLGTLAYLAGAAMFISGDFRIHIYGLILIFVSFILDACDGEVARYKKLSGGLGGVYVEPVSHDVMYSFFFLPIGIGASLSSGNLWPLVAAFVATVTKLAFRLLECRYDRVQNFLAAKSGAIPTPQEKMKTPATTSYFIYRNFFTGTGIFFVLIIAAVARRIDWFLYFYAGVFTCFWFYKLWRQQKKLEK